MKFSAYGGSLATWLLSVLGVCAAAGTVPAPDSALQAWAGRAGAVVPTVSKEMGDLGGKHFGQVPDAAKTRRYYIAAELDVWDFAPQGLDVVCGKPLPPQLAETHTAIKIRYVQYTDQTFTTRLIQTPRLGVLGPVLRGVAGDYLAVTFLNKTRFPLSMHPHGVKYDKDSEGAYYQPNPGLGAAVGPDAKFTYVWRLDEQSGPLPGEPSSKCWLYHSHVNGDDEAGLGLIGAIIVTDPLRARTDGTPKDVDREMAALFTIFNESGLSEEEEEAAEMAAAGADAAPVKTWAQIQAQREAGARYAINGYVFGNLTGLEMNEGERVRWYLFGLGDENDMHTAHWHGMRVIEEGRRRTDVVELLPATMKVADMVADNPGSWLFHCHVAEHMKEGMFTRMTVHSGNAAGVSRAPGPAFLGLAAAEQSLRIDRSELRLLAGQPPSCHLRLQGVVTVPESYAVFRQNFQVRLAGKTVVLKCGIDGKANAQEMTFRVRNADRYGMVYGGLLEFEATFSGSAWRESLEAAGISDDPSARQPLVLKLEIGAARHSATVPVGGDLH